MHPLLILIIILIHLWDAVGASIATVVAELVVTGVQCWYVRKQLPLRQCLGSRVRYLIYGLIMFLAVRGIGMVLQEGKIWVLAVMVIVGVIVYGAELVINRDPMVKMGLELIRNRKKA